MRAAEKGRRRLGGFIGQHFGIPDAPAVIEGDVHELPAEASRALPPIPVDPMAHAPNLPQLLHIDVEQLARTPLLIAGHGAGRLQSR